MTVSYGTGMTTTLQFYVIEPIDAALQRHATFMINNQQWTTGDLKGVFDDWMMDSRAKRGATGGGGWGDDWGWTHGEFLAEKNAQTPVAAEVTALDNYLDAIWARSIDNTSFLVQDWWCPAGTSAANPQELLLRPSRTRTRTRSTRTSRCTRSPASTRSWSPTTTPADTYLLRAYGILHELYAGGASGPQPLPPATSIVSTGFMGEQTLPEMAAALAAAGHTTQAAFVTTTINQIYAAFSANPYPYGSEFAYDNTAEEAVYMAAKQNNDTTVMGKVNVKTRTCRGQQPVWYYYADPVTVNGENWWQFQYTAALAGYAMDDYVRTQSTTPEVDERLSYAAKIANISAINSGQIDSNAANLGTVAWTYQGMKGNVYVNSFDPPWPTSTLHNGWRQMSGEADLGLFGAIRILSADVAVDPIFGLTGYGCNVTPGQQLLRDHADRRRVQAAEHDLAEAVVHAEPRSLQRGDGQPDQRLHRLHAAEPDRRRAHHHAHRRRPQGRDLCGVGRRDQRRARSAPSAASRPSSRSRVGAGATTTVQIGSGCGGSTMGAGGASGAAARPVATTGGGGTTGAGGATTGGGTTGGAACPAAAAPAAARHVRRCERERRVNRKRRRSAGAGGSDGGSPGATGGSSGGCACATGGGTNGWPLASLGVLAGIIAAARRRRR